MWRFYAFSCENFINLLVFSPLSTSNFPKTCVFLIIQYQSLRYRNHILGMLIPKLSFRFDHAFKYQKIQKKWQIVFVPSKAIPSGAWRTNRANKWTWLLLQTKATDSSHTAGPNYFSCLKTTVLKILNWGASELQQELGMYSPQHLTAHSPPALSSLVLVDRIISAARKHLICILNQMTETVWGT